MTDVDGTIIEGMVKTVLSKHLDNPRKTPEFHRELWDLCCSKAKRVAIAAPRGHAKSTAVAFAYTISQLLFRQRRFIVLVSATEGLAVEHLRNIKKALSDNEHLIDRFGIDRFDKDTETDFIVSFTDGYQARILAKGAEQRIRGLLWNSMRPDLIVADDLEDDEAVLNKERRDKMGKWFYSALLPCLSETGIIRVVGTILHFDSLLETIIENDDTWTSAKFRAHNPDFSEILWPEKFSKETLIEVRKGYQNRGYPEGYSQEYLNYPIDESTAYFRRTDLLTMKESDFNKPREYYAAADLAISKAAGAAYTAIAVVSVDPDGYLYLEDVRRGRWDALEILEELFSVQERYKPEIFTIESEKIQKALGPIINSEMLKRGVWINLNLVTPTKDKEQRARGIQAKMRAGGMKFNKEAEWYPAFEEELLRFPKGAYADQVDALAWTGITIDKMFEAKSYKELEDEEYEETMWDGGFYGQSAVTGY